MGFLKFLKKKGKEDVTLDDNLDIPPPPPSIKPVLPKSGMGSSNLPKDFPPFKFKEEHPIPPESRLPELPKEDFHDSDIPSFPSLEEEHEFTPKPPMKEQVDFHLPEKEPMKPAAIHEEEPKHEHIESVVKRKPLSRTLKGPGHIRLDRFKETLRNINNIRNDLKKSDEILHNLIKSTGEEGSGFEKWKNSMEDIQKKLIFVDKTLFKGD